MSSAVVTHAPRAAWPLALASAVASILAAAGWVRIVADPGIWGLCAAGVAVVVVAGVLLRCVPALPGVIAWIGQALAAAAFVVVNPASPAPVARWSTLLSDARADVAAGTAPLPRSAAIVFALLSVTLFFTLMNELLTHVARSASWTLIPLAGWFLTYALVPHSGATWWEFVACAAGYLGILCADTWQHTARWGRGLVSGGARGRGGAQVAGAAVVMGALAVAIGLAVGSAVPGVDRVRIQAASSTLQVQDPRIDLRNRLHARPDDVVLTYRTSIPGGAHLRSGVLTQLDSNGWSMATMPATQVPTDAPLSAPVGLAQPANAERSTDVSADSVPAQFLPVPYAARRVSVPGIWGYDPATLTIYALHPQATPSSGMTYHADSVDIEPTLEQLRDAPAVSGPDGTDQVPAAVPQSVRDLTEQVTAQARTPQERASAIQDFLRSNAFRYDLNVPAPDQGGMGAISDFLTQTHVGYCEHFASAMAIMARLAGIPSRVVIGFTTGTQRPDGSWAVTNANFHAWPELYFSGWGWLRFEPTPGAVSGDPPRYSIGTSSAEQPSASPSPTQSASGAEEPTTRAEATAAAAPSAAPVPSAAGERHRIERVVLPVLGLAALVAILLVPAGWRATRTRRRLRDTAAPERRTLDAWAELRDTWLDLGREWPSDSPRRLAARISAGLSADAAASVTALALAVERVRYAPGPAPDEVWGDRVRQIRRELLGEVEPGQRLRARLLPRSLRRRHPRAQS